MSGEWKPGDVAITQFGRSVVDSGRRCDNHGSKPHWHHVTNGGWDPLDAHPGASPLIVIDPEDREQGDELRDLIHKHGGVMLLGSVLQAALREFANPTPPKPDEPQGLGAVVEDEDKKWVRLDTDEAGWYPSDRAGSARCWAEFSAAVRVLSEGVVQP